MSKNDNAWTTFFDQTSTLDEIDATGYSYIKASELARITSREPRLLAKLDTLNDCPTIFNKHALTIFPVRNGEYVIFRDPDRKSYFRFDAERYAAVPNAYQSQVDLNRFDSFPGVQRLNESQALDFALLSSLLRHFTGEESLHLLIRGRTYSGEFHFDLPQTAHRVNVSSVQIEVDGGYESRDSIYLLEAKTGRREDFHIRQLYYPYLEWSARSRKNIVPIFMFVTNGKFHFFRFRFNHAFGDLEIERAESFVVNETPIARISVSRMIEQTPLESEPSTPFPQANDLDKVVDLLALLDSRPASKAEIAEHFEFDERQGDYYANAGVYLGLVERKDGGFGLTNAGNRLIGTKSLSRRTEILIEQMLKRPVFRGAFRVWQHHGMALDTAAKSEIATIIGRLTPLSGSTPPRRASTVVRWLQWVKDSAQIDA